MMDNSVHIPVELVIRSLPNNTELIELIRSKGFEMTNNTS